MSDLPETTEEETLTTQDESAMPAPTAPRRRRARTTAPEADDPSSPSAKVQKFVVRKAAIAPFGGARDALVQPGSVVELPSDLAKHYNALGFLAPYIED